jgi:hypothetical protein
VEIDPWRIAKKKEEGKPKKKRQDYNIHDSIQSIQMTEEKRKEHFYCSRNWKILEESSEIGANSGS